MIFANLITSCLLSVGVASISCAKEYKAQDHIKTPFQLSHSNDVYGGYVLKGRTDSTYQFIDNDFSETYDDEVIEISITMDTHNYCPVFATIMADETEFEPSSSMTDTSFVPMIYEFCITSSFYLSWDGTDNLGYLKVDYKDNLFNLSFDFYFQQGDTYDTLWQVEDSHGIELDYFAINFINYYSLTNAQRDLFNRLFTSDIVDNPYFTIYSGWYHFADVLPVLPNNTYFNIVGNNLYQNKLYNCLYFRSENTIVYTSWLSDYYYNGGFDDIGVSVNKFNGTNILFTNCFMTQSSYDTLSILGVPGFIPDVTDYGLDDLFIGIADTPVQFITGLFSFELFGTTFSVAFLGIVTVLAIVFIVKKVI